MNLFFKIPCYLIANSAGTDQTVPLSDSQKGKTISEIANTILEITDSSKIEDS